MSMHDHVDIDNLFAEDNLNQPGLQTGIIDGDDQALHDDNFIDTAATSQAIAELNYCGFQTRIAWSRQGHIARITDDSTSVHTRLQRFNVKSSQWELSNPRALDVAFDDAVSLAWSHTGNDLAVVDKQGRLYLFSCSPINYCHDQLVVSRDGRTEDLGPFSRCVGLYWFNQVRPDKVLKTVPESTKRDGKWQQLVVESKIFLPSNFKACCIVTATGELKVMWQRLDGQNRVAVRQLPAAALSVITHAAITATPEGRLLVSLHEYGGNISTCNVDVQFGQDMKQNPHSEAQPIITTHPVCPVLPLVPPFYDTPGPTVIGTRLLTNLEFIPTSDINWDKMNGQPSKPAPAKQPTTLVAVYSTCEAAEEELQDSVIKRWHYRTTEKALHPRFNSNSAGCIMTLVEPLPDTHIPFAISHMDLLEPGGALAISFFNTTASFYDAASLQPVSIVSDLTTVEDISNTGLNFNTSKPAVHTCLSAHSTVMACIDDDEIHLASAKYRGQAVATRLHLSNQSEDAVVAFYLLIFARSVISNAQADDLFYTISQTVSAQSIPDLLRQLYRTHTRPADFLSERIPNNVSDLERVIHKTHLAKISMFHLTLLNSASTRLVIGTEQKLVHLWLWLALNIRWTYLQLMICFQNLQQAARPGAQVPNMPTRYVNLINNNIRWIFEVFTFLFSHLIHIADCQTSSDFFSSPIDDGAELGSVETVRPPDLLTLTLNCAWSRSFLVSVVRLFGALEKQGQKTGTLDGKNQNTAEGPLAPFANEIIRCVNKYGITVRAMNSLVDAIWSADTPKENYSPEASEVHNRQIEMMITGVVPNVYQGTLSRIINECINSPTSGLRATNQIDRVRVAEHCPDISIVLLNMDDIAFEKHIPTTSRFHGLNGVHRGGKRDQRQLYHVHNKTPLFSDTHHISSGILLPRTVEELRACQIRRCNRCGSLSDDGSLSRTAAQSTLHLSGETPAPSSATANRTIGLSALYRSWPRQSLPFMGRCVCEGIWIGETVDDGLF